ncbi:hypothetical protein R1T43_12075 [Alteromonas sp. CI.11.F.A3]|uniref:hypothetical protein n=1 Tax=Alteromonas sp. CI.11.F.A3 TaxID=3079555 RepID=UPI002942330D|nr:hypothetical protein [Alteromonas sp. CI.11.F.A3]WOI35962.1 hypothetical protein R1T43_12075 [Alteromonas sp. CI.11.F.A3]
MNKLSLNNRKQPQGKQNASPLKRLFVRGHKKVGYKKTTGDLMMQLSANDHKHIAEVIAQWLTDDENAHK